MGVRLIQAVVCCAVAFGCQAHEPDSSEQKDPACCLKTEVLTTGPLSEVMKKKDLPPNVALSGQGGVIVDVDESSVDSDGMLMVAVGCSEDDVEAVVLKGRDAVKAGIAQHAPEAAGVVEAQWRVEQVEAPVGVSVYSDDEVPSAALDCVRGVIAGWRFKPVAPDAACEVFKKYRVGERP